MAKRARKAWRFPSKAAQISKNGEWNKLRIVANGPSIKTWLNGEPRAEICDNVTPRGVIGLQVHGVGNDTEQSRAESFVSATSAFTNSNRNNTLTAQEKADGWKLLWDGKTTDRLAQSQVGRVSDQELAHRGRRADG